MKVEILQVCGDVHERAVFQCGPTAMMEAVATELGEIQFPMQNLHQEEFFF